MKRMTRVGLITSGGDCQGLNAAIRGVGKALFNKLDNVEIYGFYDGYRGLIECDYKFMESRDFSGIITEGYVVDLNTIPEIANTPSGKIKFLDVAPVFARAIAHIHGSTSIADLF